MSVFLKKLEEHLIRDYINVSEIKFHPTTRGYIESNRCGIISMRDNKTGLYFLVDGDGNAIISRDYYENVPQTTKNFITVLGDWEKQTRNVI